MDNNDYDLIYGIVDELLKQVSKTVYKKYLDEKAINSVSICNLNATFRLLKVNLSYLRLNLLCSNFTLKIFLLDCISLY